MITRMLLLVMALSVSSLAQVPPLEPGVSQELAQWRAVRYSNVRYKLNLTLEKMSPVLKGTMEIRLQYAAEACAECPPKYIVLDWRKIRGHEEKSTISNVTINGRSADTLVRMSVASTRTGTGDDQSSNEKDILAGGTGDADKSVRTPFEERDEHLIFSDGVVMGENVIKLDFTSPILTSGSAITRYVDKEDGSEYLYSLFVPSDASTAFPVFDQPDLKAKFRLELSVPFQWKAVSNAAEEDYHAIHEDPSASDRPKLVRETFFFEQTKPISTYVFAFAAGDFVQLIGNPPASSPTKRRDQQVELAARGVPLSRGSATNIYIRKSQSDKFKPHAAEVFRLNREAIRYFEEYFNYKFPWPKYDLVLIPEFPFGGMEHAGATFLRESSIIFPQEPTKNDHISRALLMFHEASHQWFGDTVTMRWFDDLWLKEGFATFTAYKALEKIMPEMLSWKVFYERVKQAAYRTDSTKGTTAIYQPIANLSAAKSAYGNIVYNKAPAFLRQAEFYLGEDKFQTAVLAFLKKHEFGNAGWEDLVEEFEVANGEDLKAWADYWVRRPGLGKVRMSQIDPKTPPQQIPGYITLAPNWTAQVQAEGFPTDTKTPLMKGMKYARGSYRDERLEMGWSIPDSWPKGFKIAEYEHYFIFPNYKDYGYGIFLLDEKSREYVLKNIQNEKDPFLRSMMWGALWDSVREGELDPREFVELVVKVLQKPAREKELNAQGSGQATDDESTTALLLSHVGTSMNYYLDDKGGDPSGSEGVASPTDKKTLPTGRVSASVEDLLISGMQTAETLGQRITYYRAFLNIASSEKAQNLLKDILNLKFEIRDLKLKTKDKFDIVTKLLILNDREAPKLLAELEKTETGDDAKRYAYSARAGIPTAENKAKYWNDFVNNKEISESWIEAAFGPWNSIRHSELTLPYLQRALKELPNHKRTRKIFFVNGWLGAFIGGQRSEEALAIVNKFLADNPNLDNDLRLKILENADVIERAVKIRQKYDP